MSVQRLMKQVDSQKGVMVPIRSKGLGDSEGALKPLKMVYDDVPQSILKPIERNISHLRLVTE